MSSVWQPRLQLEQLQYQRQYQGLQPPDHLSSYLLHYADDPPSHAGFQSNPEFELVSQPCLAAQYRSMSGE
uniref:Uncharacterized protein n=1 Tax=Brassica oleracea var. oleracea TaxID=109376 RepID=A0A0D3E9P0_BRAOL